MLHCLFRLAMWPFLQFLGHGKQLALTLVQSLCVSFQVLGLAHAALVNFQTRLDHADALLNYEEHPKAAVHSDMLTCGFVMIDGHVASVKILEISMEVENGFAVSTNYLTAEKIKAINLECVGNSNLLSTESGRCRLQLHNAMGYVSFLWTETPDSYVIQCGVSGSWSQPSSYASEESFHSGPFSLKCRCCSTDGSSVASGDCRR